MARWVRRQSLEPRIEYYGLCLQEEDDALLPALYPEGVTHADGFVTAREGRVDIRSAGHTHTAAMTVEVWDGCPPPEETAWEAQGEAEIFSASGVLRTKSMGGLGLDRLLLGEPGRRWRARVCCSGRDEVAVRAALEGPVRGVEQYTVRLWPTA